MQGVRITIQAIKKATQYVTIRYVKITIQAAIQRAYISIQGNSITFQAS